MNKTIGIFLSGVMAISSCSSSEKQEEDGAATDTAETVEQTETPPATDTIKVHGKIEFNAADGLPITADSYEILPGEKYVLLCHQAGFSRGEYLETAKLFNNLGYNCLAIDQRSGEACNDIENETAKRAKEKKLKTEFTDAEADILAAIEYIHGHSGHNVIVVGSSYSAALALKIAKTNSKVAAVAAFSPGEYLKGINLQKEITGITVPVFVTCSKKEAGDVDKLLKGIDQANKTFFVPTSEGDHGSKVLWPASPSKDEYWSALSAFLKKVESSATL